MFQFAYLIFAPIIGGNLQRIGRKSAMLSGYILITLAALGFGLLVFVENE
jgi:MFS family permease